MLRCTLIFLLINSYGRSLGVPVREEGGNGTKIIIGNLLSNLSKQCKNEFVLAQIESKIHMCNVEWTFQEVPTQCLMFYDANHALCTITNVTAADLTTDFKAKITTKQSVATFCSEAAKFTLPVAMANQKTISSVLQNVVACTKVCTEEDIRTDQTNFFCKYFKWTLSKFDATPNKSTVKAADSGVSNAAEEQDDVIVHVSQAADGQPKGAADIGAVIPQTQSAQSQVPNEHLSEVPRQESSSPVQSTSIQNQESSRLQIETNSINKSTPVPQTPKNVQDEVAPDLEPINPDGEPVVGGNNGANQANNAGALNDLQGHLETQQQRGPMDSDDETGVDPEDDKDERLDTGGDDGEDPIINESEFANRPDTKDTENKIDTQSMFVEGAQRDYSQNTGFTDDDDHFFPFFLTAVIFVVVLYVLYHNKSKVGKLIFGLIVEGRQPGRRRNSRGHAYRRLDTLEQAMSANTAAPPSKIIY